VEGAVSTSQIKPRQVTASECDELRPTDAAAAAPLPARCSTLAPPTDTSAPPLARTRALASTRGAVWTPSTRLPVLVHLDHAVRLGAGWRGTAGLPLKGPRRICPELAVPPHPCKHSEASARATRPAGSRFATTGPVDEDDRFHDSRRDRLTLACNGTHALAPLAADFSSRPGRGARGRSRIWAEGQASCLVPAARSA
jgi:hypothetical protein